MEQYEVKDIVNLSESEIDQIQNKINQTNLQAIEKAYRQCRITPDDRDYLLEFYHDGMGVYREVYRALFEIFKHPEYTCAVDLSSGKVDMNETGQPINYGLKAVTPFTCTRLEYVDKFKNPIYVIFPRMKSAERAIEKLEVEYGKEYAKELARVSQDIFLHEDRERFCERLQNITKSNTKLHDILRLTITCKYYTDVDRIKRVLSENRGGLSNYFIAPHETRDRFLKPLVSNEKKYYDIKMIMHQKAAKGQFLDVEVQLKIHTLYNADLRTHSLYEKVRDLEAQIARQTFPIDSLHGRQTKAQIKILNNRIRQINENAMHQYNMMVLDKVRRIEDDGYRPLRVKPDFSDGTYHQCRQFLSREYLVESYKPFNASVAYSAQNRLNKLCFLRMLGKIDNEFSEFAPEAGSKINKVFSQLSPAEVERFHGISHVANRYASIIDRKIHSRYRQEKNGTLETPLSHANSLKTR